jgi:hypothetical protein
MPKVSYIVSAFDRPYMLRCCLASLAVQTDRDLEVIVADNSDDFCGQHQEIVADFCDLRFRHIDTGCVKTCKGWDCYNSAEYVAALPSVTSEWLCFPSDDSYYVPTFQQTMLYCAEKNGWDLVYCDMLRNDDSTEGRKMTGAQGDYYFHWNTAPHVGGIDKVGFFVKRNLFTSFPDKNTDSQGPKACDGLLIEDLVKSGVKHGKASGLIAVHN